MSEIALWNSYMSGYDFLTKVDSYQTQLRDVASALGNVRGKTVLDAGSGTGNLSIFLQDLGATVMGCDASETALEVHRKKSPKAKIFKASLEEPLPLNAETFDGVCCISVLFALSSQGCMLALNEFYRLLKSEGVLIVSIPSAERRNGQLFRLHFRSQVERHGWLGGALCAVGHLPAMLRTLYYSWRISSLPDWGGFHRFEISELQAMIEITGFKDLRISKTYGGASVLITAKKS